jgi:hypothetical protein
MALAVLLGAPRWHLPPSSPIVESQGPTLQRLERLSHLVTTRVLIADVLVGEGEGFRGAWLIKGDTLLGVNLGRAQITAKDEAVRRATICLPAPEVLQARVDHQRTRTWEVRKTSWAPWSGDPDRLRDSVMREAQRLVAHAAGSAETLAQAKLTAETLIRGFYEEVGWQVQVTWAEAQADAAQPAEPSP